MRKRQAPGSSSKSFPTLSHSVEVRDVLCVGSYWTDCLTLSVPASLNTLKGVYQVTRRTRGTNKSKTKNPVGPSVELRLRGDGNSTFHYKYEFHTHTLAMQL